MQALLQPLIDRDPQQVERVNTEEDDRDERRDAEAGQERIPVAYLFSKKASHACQDDVDQQKRPQNLLQIRE